MAEVGALVPQGANLTGVLMEFDPTPLHQVLQMSFFTPRAARLFGEMLAAKGK